MEPLGTQPAQPNPQPPVAPPPTQPAQPSAPAPQTPIAPAQPIPEPVTTPAATVERPIEAWPPAGTQAAQEIAQMQQPQTNPQDPSVAETIAATEAPKPSDAQSLGLETTLAANALRQESPVPQNPALQVGAPHDMNGITVSPAAQEIKDAAASPNKTEAPMSDQQADKLFQEEPETKERNKKRKLKKVLIGLAVTLVVVAIAGAGYIFVFGNKAAKSYTDQSPLTSYKEAFTQINTSLQKQPIDNAELEAGFSKLKVSSKNTTSLSSIPLGQLNPNYKKAKEQSKLESDYQKKAMAFQSEYSDYQDYIKSLSDSFAVVSSLDDLKDIDLTTVTSEKLSTDLSSLLKDCKDAAQGLESAAKPSELSTSSKSLQTMLVNICSEAGDSLEKGPLVQLTGKTGILDAADQLKMRGYLDNLGKTSTIVASKDIDPNADIESLTAYQHKITESASTLLQEAEAITKS